MPKKPLFVRIDENVWLNLQDYIKQVYPGSVHGALSIEVQNAITEYLRIKHAQIHTRPLNPRTPTVHNICRAIIQKCKDEGFVNQISTRVLTKIIGEIRGTDKRTQRKWLEQLATNGYIKNIGTYTWEIL